MPPSLCSLWNPRHLKWHFTPSMQRSCLWRTLPVLTWRFAFMMVSHVCMQKCDARCGRSWTNYSVWVNVWSFTKIFFFVGAKTHKTSELVRVVEKSGKSYTVKGEVGLSGLSPESRLYVELSDEGHSMCLSLEAAITAEEQRSTKNVPFFPLTIGRWEELHNFSHVVCETSQNLSVFYMLLLLGDLPTQTRHVHRP